MSKEAKRDLLIDKIVFNQKHPASLQPRFKPIIRMLDRLSVTSRICRNFEPKGTAFPFSTQPRSLYRILLHSTFDIVLKNLDGITLVDSKRQVELEIRTIKAPVER